MANDVKITFKFPPWAKRFKANQQRINMLIAAAMQTNRGLLFDKSGDYNGHKAWDELQLRDGQPLSARGTLRKSMAPKPAKGTPGPDGIVRFSGDTITIGTKIGYAWLMNWGTTKLPGGVLRPKKAKVLAIPLPPGKKRTPKAKELAKKASTIGELRVKITEMEKRLSGAKGQYRAKLAEQIERYKKFAHNRKDSDKVIFAKEVRIPARRFDDWTREDEKELADTVSNIVKRILEGK